MERQPSRPVGVQHQYRWLDPPARTVCSPTCSTAPTHCEVKWTVSHHCKLSQTTRAHFPFVLTDKFGVATEVIEISGVREAVILGSSFEQCTRHLAKTCDDAVEEVVGWEEQDVASNVAEPNA